jgi:AcrR family transcriptional regulator
VDHILSTAASLLEEVGVDAFNTNLLAERADIRVRSIYRYFPNKQAIIVALAERNASLEERFISQVSELRDPEADWRRAVEKVLDVYMSSVETVPAFAAIRLGIQATPELREIERRADSRYARAFAQALTRRGLELSDRRMWALTHMVVRASTAVIDQSLTVGRTRRKDLIEELKEMMIGYLANYLDDIPPPTKKKKKEPNP